MNEQSLHAVARGWIAEFAVQEDANARLRLGVWVDVDMTETVGMSQYWDAGAGFDIAHQLIRAAWDDKIDLIITFKERSNDISSCDELDGCVWYRCRCESGRYRRRDCMERGGRFFAACSALAQPRRITKLNIPFRIAALPDLIARAAIFAMTSGRASKIISRTPIGQVILSKVRPSSRSVFRVTLPTVPYGAHESA